MICAPIRSHAAAAAAAAAHGRPQIGEMRAERIRGQTVTVKWKTTTFVVGSQVGAHSAADPTNRRRRLQSQTLVGRR